MPEDVLDITPDPKVLLALTHTPIKPLDALCELIDNGIDSYRAALLLGAPVAHPLLEISVPGESEARRGEGTLRVRDNGPGLTRERLADALRAGFSGKNRYDTLGLFGMGFNIATGKLGRRTTVTTARRGDDYALKVILDLPAVVRSRQFLVPVQVVPKPSGLDQGTVVDVDMWWPDGDPNAGFVVQLAHISKRALREQVGRRYASLLGREDMPSIRVILNTEPVAPFEHCVWSSERFVERQAWGVIPARLDFNTVLRTQRRCVADGTEIEDAADQCIECGGGEFRTVEERVKGWVGIQRFDDSNRYGIDLIRNGRAIRVAEKDAFFEYPDDLGSPVKEYPTDQQTGRIVGEVHLDHVPVDFQKQDFQRSSGEWQRAMQFLRGGSLLPSSWPPGTRNESPVSKLFQGYRKLRNFGRPDMYMGRYDEAAGKAVRIGRDVEAELYRRFLNHEPGYYDDREWWEYVENATVPPVATFATCPHCDFQNVADAEVCADCEAILDAKPCVACNQELPRSAVTCESCGASQIPEVREPWTCQVCQHINGVDDDQCVQCESLRGAENPADPEVLWRMAVKLDSLCFSGKTFETADGKRSEPLDVTAFRMDPTRPRWDGPTVPTLAVKQPGAVDVFLDLGHRAFTQLHLSPEEAVAVEAAQYLYNMRLDLTGRPGHSVANLAVQIMQEVWGESLSGPPVSLTDQVRDLFAKIALRLETIPQIGDFMETMDEHEQRDFAQRLIADKKLEELEELRSTGRYIRYVSAVTIARLFDTAAESWFGVVWADRLPDERLVGRAAAESAKHYSVGSYSRCLNDCASFLQFPDDDKLVNDRVRAAAEYLESKLV
ncbi:Double zinc ribbon [Geodermatophilus obscurus]|uniref:Double zinc ribbon n=1 Tax=Geodermatophilus obscurus TaxID=1861 RepID=A0A1I5H352_9ACTN|nr:ATP-binding protein [Geodermatophilus obscurus]SFO42665.1 Double zinc ribbon [Geodermatophilus obscurus]